METKPNAPAAVRGAATELSTTNDGLLTIMTWNINCLTPTVRNMELRHRSFRGFLDHFRVDIACFQEVKLPAARMTKDLAIVEGFQSFWATSKSKPGYSGVTTWCRFPLATPQDAAVDCLGGDEQPDLDSEGRVVLTDHGAFVLLNVYVPNAGDRPERARLPYKLAFLEALRRKMDELSAAGRLVIAVGDFNVAAQAADVHPSLGFDNMYDERELAAVRRLATAYPDAWRVLHPKAEGSYTVWDERTSARSFNVGLRIDYVLVSPALLPYVASCDILSAADIPPKWSDHAAIVLRLRMARGGLAGAVVGVRERREGEQEQEPQSLRLNPPSQTPPAPSTAATAASAPSQDGGESTVAPDDNSTTTTTAAASPVPRLPLPPPPSTPCALWTATEARFVDKAQKSIRDLFTRRPSGGPSGSGGYHQVPDKSAGREAQGRGGSGDGGSDCGGRKRALPEGSDAAAEQVLLPPPALRLSAAGIRDQPDAKGHVMQAGGGDKGVNVAGVDKAADVAVVGKGDHGCCGDREAGRGAAGGSGRGSVGGGQGGSSAREGGEGAGGGREAGASTCQGEGRQVAMEVPARGRDGGRGGDTGEEAVRGCGGGRREAGARAASDGVAVGEGSRGEGVVEALEEEAGKDVGASVPSAATSCGDGEEGGAAEDPGVLSVAVAAAAAAGAGPSGQKQEGGIAGGSAHDSKASGRPLLAAGVKGTTKAAAAVRKGSGRRAATGGGGSPGGSAGKQRSIQAFFKSKP